MADGHCFISYSHADGLSFASQLTKELRRRYPTIKVWFDKINLVAGEPWDIQIAQAIRSCECLVFIMTDDSVTDNSICRDELTWALKYKKPIIPLRFHPNAELPFRLNNLQYIDFVNDFKVGVRQLSQRIIDLDSPKGLLVELKHRLVGAQRDIRRAPSDNQPRIQIEIDELNRQIEDQERIVNNPLYAEKQTHTNLSQKIQREPRILRAFLCHSSRDKDRARDIYRKLINHGYDVWIDEKKLLPGQEWELEIEKAIKSSDAILICLSAFSINSEGYLQKEIRVALDRADRLPENDIFIIPCRLDPIEMPSRLRKYQWADLFAEDGLEKLESALELKAHKLGLNVKRL